MRLPAYAFVILLSCVCLNMLTLHATAQGTTDGERTQNSAEEDAVKSVALDYAMSWYTGDPERMERALHPKLAKRRPMPAAADEDASLHEMTAQQLVDAVATGNGKQTPEDERRADVEVFDITNGIATVKLDMRGWTDYMHLAKYEDKWVIVNVLWQVHAAE